MTARAVRKPAMGVAMTHKSQWGEDANKDANGADEMPMEPGKVTPGR
jgi:hypothetical protein